LQQEILALEANITNGEKGLLPDLIQQRQILDQFRQDSLGQYPTYTNIRTPQPVSLATLQQELLDKDQALLQYFIGDTTLYCLYADQEDAKLYQVPLRLVETDLTDLVAQFRKLLAREDSSVEAFHPLAQQLCHLLLEQPLRHLQRKPHIGRLLVIPEGVLAHVPWEVLPTNTLSPESMAYTAYPYLLREYALSYAYSASVLQLQRKSVLSEDLRMGAFAVQDYGSYPSLHNLFTEDASIAIDIFGGEIIGNPTREEFLSRSPDYSLLHLSLHAFGDEQHGLQSYLVFTDSIVQASDIYTLRLPAHLVVLSGCETGKGSLQGGEGVMSLAHAFAYAGVSSTLISLWQLGDLTARDILKDFYQNIKGGTIPKDVALQQAKLSFIGQHSYFANPHYWAVMLSYGDLSALPPVRLVSSLEILKTLFILAFLAIVIFIVYKSRRRDKVS